ncbi:DnaJ domain-containing protein [Candidatus Pacearchaeota archaeon]|nr:DnaJ domain-containing protein [Candidatus Pacearchaeota archaeon]
MEFAEALKILDLPAGGVTLKRLKKAYKKKAFITHPDKKGGSHKAFIRVKKAYDFFIKRGPQPVKQQPVRSEAIFHVHHAWTSGTFVNTGTVCA